MAETPRAFISYCWSTPEHEQWVLSLATELVRSGVHVVFDKWDLQAGGDAVAFMESMATDESIKKVILVCDEAYARKADSRADGVGTETQIITAEIYAKSSQDKFAAVVAERDGSGRVFLPTYYKSRIYIDLSEAHRYAEEFEKLIRWIFNKPLHVRPELGEPPSYISDPDAQVLGVSGLARRYTEAIQTGRLYAQGALDEYLSTFSTNLERFRIALKREDTDELIVKSIDDFMPARDEFIRVTMTMSRYSDPLAGAHRLHRFFESLIQYLYRPANVTSGTTWDLDNFKFIIHELFLYALAILLRGDHIEAATHLLAQPYYVPQGSDRNESGMRSYTELREHMASLEERNKRLQLNRVSLRADLLEDRSKTSGLTFGDLMQGDLVCFLRSMIIGQDFFDLWYPETLLYATRQHGPFEIFARASSKGYLARVLPLLGASSVDEIRASAESQEARQSLPRSNPGRANLLMLMAVEKLGSRA